jgi:hypothetical protein
MSPIERFARRIEEAVEQHKGWSAASMAPTHPDLLRALYALAEAKRLDDGFTGEEPTIFVVEDDRTYNGIEWVRVTTLRTVFPVSVGVGRTSLRGRVVQSGPEPGALEPP